MTSAYANSELDLEDELLLRGVHRLDISKEDIRRVYLELTGKSLAKACAKGASLGKLSCECKDRAAIIRKLVDIAEHSRKERPLSAKAARERKETCERLAKYVRDESDDRAALRKLLDGFPREEKQICAAIEQMRFCHVRGVITPFSESRYTPSSFHRTWFKLAQEPGRYTVLVQSSSYDAKANRVNISLVRPTTIAGYELKTMSLELCAHRDRLGKVTGLSVVPREPSCFECISYWCGEGVFHDDEPAMTWLDTTEAYIAPHVEEAKASAVKRKPVANPEEEDDDDNTPITQLKRQRVGEQAKPSQA